MVFTFQPPFFSGLSGYVAELGSAFLCAALGIVPTVRHADYLGAWLAVCQEDNRAIFRAASAASKAADWILARHAEARTGEGREMAAQGAAASRPGSIIFAEAVLRRAGRDGGSANPLPRPSRG